MSASVVADLEQQIDAKLKALVSVEQAVDFYRNPLQTQAESVRTIIMRTMQTWIERCKEEKLGLAGLSSLVDRDIKISKELKEARERRAALEEGEDKKNLATVIGEIEELEIKREVFAEVDQEVEEGSGFFAYFTYQLMKTVQAHFERGAKPKKGKVEGQEGGFLDKKLKLKSDELEKQNRELKATQDKIREVQVALRKAKADETKAKVDLRKKQKEVTAVKQRAVKEAETTKTLEQKFQKVKEEKDAKKAELAAEREELKKTKQEKAELEKKREKKTDLLQESKQMDEDLEKTKKLYEKQRQEFNTVRQHSDDQKTSLRKLRKKMRAVDKEVKTLHETLGLKLQQHEALSLLSEEVKSKSTTLEELMGQSQKVYDELMAGLAKMSSEVEQLTGKAAGRIQERDQLKVEIAALEEHVPLQRDLFKAFQQEGAVLQDFSEKTREELEKRRKESEALTKEKEVLEDRNTAVQQELASLTQALKEASSKYERISLFLEEAEAEELRSLAASAAPVPSAAEEKSDTDESHLSS